MKAPGCAAAVHGKASPAAADCSPACSGPPLSFLKFGDALYKSFVQQPEDAAARLPLTRYADYLHHFGFSVERESRGGGGAGCLDGDMNKATTTATRSSPSPGSGPLINCSCEDPSALSDTADWGLSEDIKTEADQRSESVGALGGVSDCGAVAKQLTAPFHSVTWRQTATQCAMKKARCVFTWLCANIALQLRPLDEAADGGGQAAGTPKSQRSAPGSIRANRPSKKEKEAAAAQEPVGPVDLLAQAMTARRATPPLLAQLYASMLGAVGVKCEVVAGQLKGVAPGEAFDWAWNKVCIDSRFYLVDVAAALSDGVLRAASDAVPTVAAVAGGGKPGTSSPANGGGAATTTAAATTATVATGAGNGGGGASLKTTAADEAIADAAGAGSYGIPCLRSSTPPAMRRDFFFFTHPCLFLSSHLPTNAAASLVVLPTKALHWILQPCVTPAFYHYGLQLVSHPSHATISAGSAPSYVSLMNKAPGTTELCCVLFSGTLQSLPEDVARNTPLGPEWVWHQRDDTANVETFTLTVPQAGYYVAVVGARSIRADPYSATIAAASAEAAFTPVVSYEVRVGFTSSGAPVLPRQYLSPSICRLMRPLCAQITPGTQKFSVMPSCSNVLSVAVVRRTAPPSPPQQGSSATENSHNSSDDGNGRSLITFLPFQMERAAFEGSVGVRAGDIIELWLLYGAPDRNGQQLTQRVNAMKANVSVEEPAAAEAKAVNKKKKKTAMAESHAMDNEALVQQLDYALSRGEVFQLFVGSIEVKHFVSPAVMSIIQPQPTVEQEQAVTLRRLAGVTDALLSEAEHTAQYQATPVGSYFGAIATPATTR